MQCPHAHFRPDIKPHVWMFICLNVQIGSLIDIPGVIGPLSARSLASKCVLRDERGRLTMLIAGTTYN